MYGEDFVTEPRSAEGKLDRLPGLAAELVRLEVDVILGGGPVLVSLKNATSTIPVVMVGAGDPVRQGFAQSLGRPGGNLTGMSIQMVETTGKRLELLKELVRMARGRVGGVLVHSAALTARANTVPLAKLALKHRLPTMFGNRENVVAGGLMSYGPDHVDLTRRAAVYIDKIVRGAKPADLPVEQASQYRLVINRKTANALGLTIPPSTLSRADEVIE